MKALIIVPAYNEEKNIVKTITDIQENASQFDYVIINDCSKDSTADVCARNGFNVVNLPVNLGIGGAVQTGYRYALSRKYEVAVQFDGDGQHSAKFLSEMLDELRNNQLDAVIGSRFIEKMGFQSTGARRIGIHIICSLIHILTGRRITDPTSGMRMINARLIKKFADDYPSDYPEPESLVRILKEGYRVKEVAVIMNKRENGTSSINSVWKSVYYMIKVCVAIVIAKLG